MLRFFWSDNHLGWGLFAFAVYSCLLLLAIDWAWRRWVVKRARLLQIAGLAWAFGVGAIALVAWLSAR